MTRAIFTPTTAFAPIATMAGPVTVVRALTAAEVDSEVGPMYRICTDAGVEADAFADELTQVEEAAP